MNVNQIITQRIIQQMKEALEKGEKFYWVRPFSEGAPEQPFSYEGSVPYRGINRLLLPAGEYLTYNKMNEISKKTGEDYHIRKGSHSHIAIYYGEIKIPTDEQDEESSVLKKGFLKYYRVFDRTDIINKDNEPITSKFDIKRYSHEEMEEKMMVALDKFNNMVERYCKDNDIEMIIVKDGASAYFSYNPSDDSKQIRMPDMANFQSVYDYIHTTAHEMIHSTGVKLNRELASKKNETSYSKEELIAEIGAEMIIQNLGIPDDSIHKTNTIAYIQSWISHLDNNPNEIVSAASKAEKACDFVLEYAKDLEKEELSNVKENKEKGEDR